MFHVERFILLLNSLLQRSTWNVIKTFISYKHVSRGTFLKIKNHNVSRGTLKNKKEI